MNQGQQSTFAEDVEPRSRGLGSAYLSGFGSIPVFRDECFTSLPELRPLCHSWRQPTAVRGVAWLCAWWSVGLQSSYSRGPPWSTSSRWLYLSWPCPAAASWL